MVSYHSAKFDGHRYCESADMFFEFVKWLLNQKVTWLWRWGSFNASYDSAKFGGHRYCGRADIRLFICFSFKSMQNKDFNFQVYISLSIYLMTTWLNKNNYFVEYINNYFVEYINNSLNQKIISLRI